MKKTRIYSDKVVQWLRGRKSSSGRLTLYVEQKFKNQSLKIKIVVFPNLSIKEARYLPKIHAMSLRPCTVY
ncbi:integrase [Orientia tsutsugamushi]|uniref:Integrase n=1 Tax=Orientia tsutsugamushi TaxID=784 RepID=A0A2U3QW82_ORITS|nr:hypothetical protein OTSUT76_2340 [Orientia tsutsugamushi str. UT76]SPR05245.1 integrase [Orientia tsutsugamushi]